VACFQQLFKATASVACLVAEIQIFLVVVLVWAPAPFVCLFVVSLDETQVWLGICGSSGWVVCCCGCCDLPHFQTVLVLVQSDVLPLMLM
jgi:hypothetical protein